MLNHEQDDRLDFLGLFDGHGTNGENLARFVAENVCDIVLRRHSAQPPDGRDFCQAIVSGCLELDELARRSGELLKDAAGRVVGGSTSLACWFRNDRIYCANVGDSRMVVSVCGEAVTVTEDHKPSKKEEKFRIIRAGGYVSNDRVMETLAVARSFGDFGFKVISAHAQPISLA